MSTPLDRYDVIRELGRGGMAVVHLARQRDLDRLIALKELAGFNSGDPDFAERFLRESRTTGALAHPNIVTVFDYFQDNATAFIAMELLDGGSLRPLIGTLSLPQTAGVLEGILAGVGVAAAQGIVHRDLKPENVLVTSDGRIKVADFGIARATSAAQGDRGNLTSTGMTVGTPTYMSPEQAMASEDISPASDLYAIGCMAYEMLTGRVPFEDNAQMAVLMKHINTDVPDVREIDPNIPEEIAAWVGHMCRKDPDERPESAQAAWEEFEDAVLTFVGPTWRRGAKLEASGTLDLSDVAPMGPTPIRPTSMGTPAPAAPTGFETYVAPAAMHEVLGTERRTPPPVTAATPAVAAPQVVTPPPRPAVVTPAPVTAARPTPPPIQSVPEETRSPVAAMAIAGLVAAGAGFALLAAGGGGSSAARAEGPGLSVVKPDGATTAKPLPGLGPDATAFAVGGRTIALGRVQNAGPLLLPAGMQPGSAAPQRVSTKAGEAVLHRGARAGGRPVDVYVLPTSKGNAVVACAAGTPTCGAVAASLQISDGDVRDLGPTEEGGQSLTIALTSLKTALSGPQDDLGRAGSRSAQATAAGDLGRAYAAGAKDVADTPIGALGAEPLARLATALGDLGRGWTRYASAARSGDAGGVAAARRTISAARGQARSARAALARAGYREASA